MVNVPDSWVFGGDAIGLDLSSERRLDLISDRVIKVLPPD